MPHFSSTPVQLCSDQRLSKIRLSDCEVIGQIDDKFVLLKIRSANDLSPRRNLKFAEMLVLVDQHAADERARLENFVSCLCEAILLKSEISHRLVTPIRFTIWGEESLNIRRYTAEFGFWGIACSILESVTEGVKGKRAERTTIEVTSVPIVLYDRYISEPGIIPTMIRQHMQDIFVGKVPRLENHKSRERLERSMPRVLRDVLISKACRGIVDFGYL